MATFAIVWDNSLKKEIYNMNLRTKWDLLSIVISIERVWPIHVMRVLLSQWWQLHLNIIQANLHREDLQQEDHHKVHHQAVHLQAWEEVQVEAQEEMYSCHHLQCCPHKILPQLTIHQVCSHQVCSHHQCNHHLWCHHHNMMRNNNLTENQAAIKMQMCQWVCQFSHLCNHLHTYRPPNHHLEVII